jgi:hypothetical protein
VERSAKLTYGDLKLRGGVAKVADPGFHIVPALLPCIDFASFVASKSNKSRIGRYVELFTEFGFRATYLTDCDLILELLAQHFKKRRCRLPFREKNHFGPS